MTFGARFLTAPDLFPARIAGETFGEESIDVDLPAGPYRISGLTAAQRDAIAARFGHRAIREGRRPDAEIVVHRAPAGDFVDVDTRGWEYTLDFEGSAIAGLRLMARIEGRRSGIWTAAAEPNELWGVVENVLRPLVATRLLASGGLLVHSAAVALDGRGFLFAGPSGAGKSTLALLALAAGHPVLGDDLTAIDSDLNLVPLPFTGDLDEGDASREPVPLSAIVAIEKGDRESIRVMTIGETIALLVRTAPYVGRDELLLERAGAIAGSVRHVILTFRRDGDVWPILRSL